MELKKVSEKDRLLHEMRSIYQRLGKVIQEYEATTARDAKQSTPKNLAIIDPVTKKPLRMGGKK